MGYILHPRAQNFIIEQNHYADVAGAWRGFCTPLDKSSENYLFEFIESILRFQYEVHGDHVKLTSPMVEPYEYNDVEHYFVAAAEFIKHGSVIFFDSSDEYENTGFAWVFKNGEMYFSAMQKRLNPDETYRITGACQLIDPENPEEIVGDINV